LPGADANDARYEHAAVLVHDDSFCVGLEFLAFEAGLNVDEGVGQAAVFFRSLRLRRRRAFRRESSGSLRRTPSR
jgi:hypothetical protein